MTAPSRLWAVTCLFNPAGYRVREYNFREFRRRLPVPLLAVELAFDSPFALSNSDADIIVRLRDGDPMWQKERLLNVAVSALPSACDQVVWIDADVVISEDRWATAVSRALDTLPVVQPFTVVHHLSPMNDGVRVSSNLSTMAAVSCGRTFDELIGSTLERAAGAPVSGHVWAARRELLRDHGLYDGCIVGGGDTAFVCAVTGHFEQAVRVHCMSTAQERRYRAWAEGIFAQVRGRVGTLPSEVEHLWHGALKDRQGRERHVRLSELGFDPYHDVRMADSGAWRWASDRPELHRYVREYFQGRNEDSMPSVARHNWTRRTGYPAGESSPKNKYLRR